MDGTRQVSRVHSVVEREQRELRRPGWAVSFNKHIRMCRGLHFCCCWRSVDWGEGDASQIPEPGLRLFWSQFKKQGCVVFPGVLQRMDPPGGYIMRVGGEISRSWSHEGTDHIQEVPPSTEVFLWSLCVSVSFFCL